MNYIRPRTPKEVYFQDGNANALDGLSDEIRNEWITEKELINCLDCRMNAECIHARTSDRLPADAGGKGQCIRLAEHLSPYAFQNTNGDVITIPSEIVAAIRKGGKK